MTSNSPHYRPELDVLRFFAFLAIFLHHFLPHNWPAYSIAETPARWIVAAAMAGGFGVELFFALSAFLITGSLLRELEATGTIDSRAFWKRRALRIWPLYFLFLVLTLTLVPQLLPGDRLLGLHTIPFFLFLGNWTCAFRGYPPSVAAPLWAISIMEQFYLIWPGLLLLCRRKPWRAAVGLLVAAWLMRIVLVVVGLPHPGIYANTFARMDALLLGALFAMLARKRPLVFSPAKRLLLMVGAVGFAIILFRVFGENAWAGVSGLIIYPAGACVSVVILMAALRTEPADSKGLGRDLAYLGRISFGLYVFHLFAIRWISRLIQMAANRGLTDGRLPIPVWLLSALALTIGLAAVSYHLVEQRFLRLKRPDIGS